MVFLPTLQLSSEAIAEWQVRWVDTNAGIILACFGGSIYCKRFFLLC
jgi:hypothetical protein